MALLTTQHIRFISRHSSARVRWWARYDERMTKGAPDPPAPTPPAREQADPRPSPDRHPSPDKEQADSGAMVQDPRLLDAARRVLRDAGWEGLTIEAVAEA